MTTATKPEQTAVAKPESGIRLLLTDERARERIEPFLMPGASYDRVMAGAHFAARQNPAILECTPASIIDAVARTQQWGLEIGITAHLVPFNTNIGTKEKPHWAKICTPIQDYKGIAHLMVRSCAVRHVEMRVVYEKDSFEYSYGTDSHIHHVPSAAAGRGKITHAYTILRLRDGTFAFDVMPVEDIEAIRSRYSKQWKSGELPAWYAKKTSVRQSAKLVPSDPRFASALQAIREGEGQDYADFEIPPGADERAEQRAEEDAARGRARHGLRNIVNTQDVTEGIEALKKLPAGAGADMPDPYADEMTDDQRRAQEAWASDDELPLGDTKQGKRKDALAEGR